MRLEGIDAPEFSQPFYYQAKRYLSDACLNETVTFHGRERDRYDRIVGRVYVDSRDIGLDLLKAGLAWHFVRYNNEPAYANAESEARRRGRGLWADSHPVPPWEWRRNHDTQSKNRSDQ